MRFFNRMFKKYELKIHRGVISDDMKNDANFEEEFTCHFKLDMRNLTNFVLST